MVTGAISGSSKLRRLPMTFKNLTLLLTLGAAALAGCGGSSDGPSTGGASNDATLGDLVVTADDAPATLAPAFDPGVHAYSVTLRAGTQALTVAPTANDDHTRSIQLVQLDGSATPVASGAATSIPVPAAGAASSVRVVVTAEDGVTTTGYTIRLTRNAVGTNATLASLTDSAGLLHYTAGTLSYPITLSPTQTAGYTITPTLTDPFATMTINGAAAVSGAPAAVALGSSSATVTIVVTAEDGIHQTTYTLGFTVSSGNTAPVANAGPDQSVIIGDQVTLDGSGSSDADGDPLSYAWSFQTLAPGSSATLSGANTAHPTFTADVTGQFTLRLVVNDGHVDSNAVMVNVTVNPIPVITFTPTYAMFSSPTNYFLETADPAVAAYDQFNGMGSTVASVPPVNIFSGGTSAGKLRLYKQADGVYTVYYNGNTVAAADISGGVIAGMSPTTSSSGGLQRYVSIPYTATARPVTATASFTYQGTACTTGHVMLVKSNGTILADQVACSATGSTPSTITATFTDASSTQVFFVFSRGTDTGGGVHLWSMQLSL
jgi:hypothetical protein